MQIDRLTVQNFKGFVEQTFELHPQFNLLVGENGSGKTSALDALAVGLGLWHKVAPRSGWRNILEEEIRLEPQPAGDRIQFLPRLPTRVTASGTVGAAEDLRWTRMIREGGTRTTNAEAKQAEEAIAALVREADARQRPLPVLAYYGAGRTWLATNKKPVSQVSHRKPTRFDAYSKCLDTRIRDQEVNEWFLFETAAATNGHGSERPGYRAVKAAVLGCVPDADGLRYDADRKEIVLSIHGHEQPYYNLSAGQRMMLALVADIAIKAVTLNSYLLGAGQPAADDPAQVLTLTPGVVLIDELDVHLHPRWQRRVAADLKRVFPAVQFVCTSHSPQVIGEVPADQVLLLDADRTVRPAQSFGMDSNWVLQVLMRADEQDPQIKQQLNEVFRLIEERTLGEAEKRVLALRTSIGNSESLQRAASTIERVRLLGR